MAQGPVLVLGALLLRPLDRAGDVTFVILTLVGVVGPFACGWVAVVLARALGREVHDG